MSADVHATTDEKTAAAETVRSALTRLAARDRFGEAEAYELFTAIMQGAADTSQIAALLMGLRVRGETVDEITGFARAMREQATRIRPAASGRIVDTCGTGGAAIKTFNCSTAAAFVAAGAGVTVAKHGNRSVTSPCGSADVLEALGADLARSPDEVQQIVEQVGIGFLFAPTFHPAMKHAIPARQALKIRTVFNVLGPLTNPAGADAQVLGVFSPDLVDPLARVLANLGVVEAMVVHGDGGLDEVSPIGPTRIAHVRQGKIEERVVTPREFGIDLVQPDAIAGRPPQDAARALVAILDGEPGPLADFIALNAACAIVVGGHAADLHEGLEAARASIRSGAARDRLARYVQATGGELMEGPR